MSVHGSEPALALFPEPVSSLQDHAGATLHHGLAPPRPASKDEADRSGNVIGWDGCGKHFGPAAVLFNLHPGSKRGTQVRDAGHNWIGRIAALGTKAPMFRNKGVPVNRAAPNHDCPSVLSGLVPCGPGDGITSPGVRLTPFPKAGPQRRLR